MHTHAHTHTHTCGYAHSYKFGREIGFELESHVNSIESFITLDHKRQLHHSINFIYMLKSCGFLLKIIIEVIGEFQFDVDVRMMIICKRCLWNERRVSYWQNFHLLVNLKDDLD